VGCITLGFFAFDDFPVATDILCVTLAVCAVGADHSVTFSMNSLNVFGIVIFSK